ncbi:MAG: urease accessory protein UreF [Marinosulfonomonas sp.]|nr:urease accessory protein UreF [Marinosulfonomonas sp.]
MATPTDPLSPDALLTLAQWLSPAYPTGAFSYSQGLEWAVENGDIADAATLETWLSAILQFGAGRNDAIFVGCAYGAATPVALQEIDELACAMVPSSERLLETTQQGAAFAATVRATTSLEVPDLSLPVAIGCAAQKMGLPLGATIQMYLHAMVSNLVSAAVRLVPLGQTEGQVCLTRLSPLCIQVADNALTSGIEDLGSSTFAADIASMKHETQHVRLFRS